MASPRGFARHQTASSACGGILQPGERIERVVLFGSYARGDARADSDYDVLVFLNDFDVAGRHASANG